MTSVDEITVVGSNEHNLKNIDITIKRNEITVITGVSGSGKSSLAFDTILAESQRRFFYTLSQYSRQFLDMGTRPAVRKVTGLSPAISLRQNETQPSPLASVGTQTDLSELFGVLLANHGEKSCPKHGKSTTSLSLSEISKVVVSDFFGATIAICAPICRDRKGSFTKQLSGFHSKGYGKVYIDGKIVGLSPLPKLKRDEKHTIKVIVDLIKIKPESENRVFRAVEVCTEQADGYAEVYEASASQGIDIASGRIFSTSGGCGSCGYAWPRLDPRFFSSNSIGRCSICSGTGILPSSEGDSNNDFGQADLPEAGAKKGREKSVDLSTREEFGTKANKLSKTDKIDRTLPSKKKQKEKCPQKLQRSISTFVDIDSFSERCGDCLGTGLSSEYNAIKLGEYSPQQIHLLPMDELAELVRMLVEKFKGENLGFSRVAEEILQKISQLEASGLGYLHMARRVVGLSGGEAQRLRLASIVSENLRGVIYVLDEPSQGLHPREIEGLWETLQRLKAKGNTVILVDHDEFFIRHADLIVDLGPGGGELGGEIVGVFSPKNAAKFAKKSLTAQYMSGKLNPKRICAPIQSGKNGKKFLTVIDACKNNLKMTEVQFLLGGLNVVAGVSGAGKSSLVNGVLYANLVRYCKIREENDRQRKRATFNKSEIPPPVHMEWRGCGEVQGLDDLVSIELIDRKSIAKSTVSMPVTYLDIFTDIRKLYETLPDTQLAGLTAKSFSLFSEGGRCPECKGRGEITTSMRFLADVRILCSVCFGKRYKDNVCLIEYKGKSISEVLNMTIDEAITHFKNHKKIVKRLLPAVRLGLGYLKLSQTSASLSGGEAQRLKLVRYFGRTWNPGTVLVLDEPTRGLHFADVHRLMLILRQFVVDGLSVIVIEHNPEVILQADWVVDVGPGASSQGGTVVYQGSIPGLLETERSVTGGYLKQIK